MAREAVVASLDPGSGKIWNDARFAVRAALLLELVHEGRLTVSRQGRATEVAVRDATPVGDPELDEALEVIGSGLLGRRVTRLLDGLPHASQVVERMVLDGVLHEEVGRRLGLIPVRRYRAMPAADRDRVVARIRDVFFGSGTPGTRDVLLAASLVDVHPKVFLPREQVKDAWPRLESLREDVSPDAAAVLSAIAVAQGNANGDVTSGL